MTLEDYEERMEKAAESVGACLLKIRDGSLYLSGGYKSFEDYVERRWGYKKTHAYRLIDHAKVAKILITAGIPVPSEGQLRPAMSLKRLCKTEDEFLDKVVNVVEITQDRVPSKHDVPQLTSADIQRTVEDFGISRPKQDMKPELREIKRLVLGIHNSIVVAKYDGAKFKKKYGSCLSGAEVAHQFLTEYLECGDE